MRTRSADVEEGPTKFNTVRLMVVEEKPVLAFER